MGRSTVSVAVKFAARLCDHNERVKKLVDLDEGDYPLAAGAESTVVKGWIRLDCVQYNQRRTSLYTDSFTKDQHVVYVVNEAEYENVGDLEYTAFSDTQEALVEFLKDFSFPAEIEESVAVQQTL